jgi:hypothetical protein
MPGPHVRHPYTYSYPYTKRVEHEYGYLYEYV